MNLKTYWLVVLVGMLWSTSAMAGTVNTKLAEVGELAANIYGIGPKLAQGIVNLGDSMVNLLQSKNSRKFVELD